ncbi:hypothetical protein [Mucilaginibacter sp.]|uniref:LIC_13387 family protein n=1 Tax=Mucilaginibacter sp. TaxID=1882438 RepID=UPI00262D2868|nr:hypothetical protein [Mucilaginibacter sp.]MDB4922090.1 hypothetical protein [Mucilaginibacter sp.]
MKPKLLLRISAILMFLHTVGHTFGALSWKNAPNPSVGQVISGMQKNHFEFMGRSTTLASFFEGYGYTMILVLLLISVLLWLLAAEINNRLSAKLLPLLSVFLLLMAIIEYIYFFAFAAAFSLLAGLCTLLALFTRRTNLNTSKD